MNTLDLSLLVFFEFNRTVSMLSALPPPLLLGCYTDNNSRVFPTTLMNIPGSQPAMSSPGVCQELAANASFQFFGIEVAHECYGGNVWQSITSLGASTNCNQKCGNGDMCGGGFALSVYQTGTDQVPSFYLPKLPPCVPIPLPSGHATIRGCFQL